MMEPTRSLQNFNFGFSSSVVFLCWAIWGGFLLHMVLSNYLAVLIKPVYDQPIKNIDDVLGKKLISSHS